MRLVTGISIVLLAVLVGLMVACSSPASPNVEPTPNIESTVEARLVQERAIEATIAAKVLEVVEAIPSVTPYPTYTPIPTLRNLHPTAISTNIPSTSWTPNQTDIPTPYPTPYPTYTSYPTNTPYPTPYPTYTSYPTNTPYPTPYPTYTPYPTNTPYPTPTLIPTPTSRLGPSVCSFTIQVVMPSNMEEGDVVVVKFKIGSTWANETIAFQQGGADVMNLTKSSSTSRSETFNNWTISWQSTSSPSLRWWQSPPPHIIMGNAEASSGTTISAWIENSQNNSVTCN